MLTAAVLLTKVVLFWQEIIINLRSAIKFFRTFSLDRRIFAPTLFSLHNFVQTAKSMVSLRGRWFIAFGAARDPVNAPAAGRRRRAGGSPIIKGLGLLCRVHGNVRSGKDFSIA